MDDLDDIIDEFLVESFENIDRIDIELVELEEHPDSPHLLASIFRNLHTIKGTSGFFGFSKLEKVSHAGENLLSLLRSGDLLLDTAIADALLSTVDAIRSMLDSVRATRNDGDEPHTELIARLHELVEPAAESQAATPESETDPAVAEGGHRPGTGVATVAEQAGVAEQASEAEQAGAGQPPGTGLDETEPPPKDRGGQSKPADTTIRVDVGLLDRLMNLVGELVLARNQVLQCQSITTDASFQTTAQQLDLITTELQESVMKTRMQPIGNVWAKLPRVVRDLAATCSKKVRIEMEGEDTELDKTILEAIKDPLTHIVRNSVDHGLEAPDDRAAVGKPPVGLLQLRALHQGGQVIIEIIDDGAGLNLERIKSKAIDAGLISPARAATMSDRDVANLICLPGFSTAATVTNVSGRGVGLDVVKTHVEKIGGSLDIQSDQGAGTTFTITIPLTLAIIPALIVSCADDRYLISQINLVEVLHIDSNSGETKIEMAGDAPVLRLRGSLLPVVHLREVLGLEAADAEEPDGVSIAVLHADGCQFGLVVDHINDTEEIVVKPLSPHLKSLGAFAGTTIMGDGAVSLILDATGVARLGGVLRDQSHAASIASETDRDDQRASTEMVLVCSVGESRIGIPLALISRLEELPVDQIERAAGHDVIQYRDRLLRLIYLDEVLQPGPVDREQRDGKLQVLVYEKDDRIHGLVVGDIVDVFETDLSNGEPADRVGLQMSGVIGRRVTDLLDIDEIIAETRNRRPLVGSGSAS